MTNLQTQVAPKKRGRPPKNKPIDTHEINSADNIYEFNTSLYSMTAVFGDYIDSPYDIKDIQTYMKNPMLHNEKLRELAWWSYRSNGTISSAIDYMRSMHTLDRVIYSKNKGKDKAFQNKVESNKAKMESTLDTIKYKQFLRDGLLKDLNDGISFYYFEVTNAIADNTKFLSDVDVMNIVDINEAGLNASIIALPVDYCKIISRKNSVYVGAFDLKYFQQFSDSDLRKKLISFPKEVRDGWDKYKNSTAEPWLILNPKNTIITKIKSAQNEPWGIPMPICALDDILYANHFINTKRNILDDLNNQIFYETFPEGEKGRSALTTNQQTDQHNTVKGALFNNSNQYGKAFFSLAAGTKLDQITIDTSIFDQKNETSVKNNVSTDIGMASSILDGNSNGNYATSTINLELISSNIYSIISDFMDELNKVIGENIIKDKACKVECYILPTTFVNRDKLVKYMSDLYARGKGSLTAWIASTGFNSDAYISLMEQELALGYENKFPVHATSFTMSGKDMEGADKDQSGGRPTETDSTNSSTIKSQNNGGNSQPKPST